MKGTFYMMMSRIIFLTPILILASLATVCLADDELSELLGNIRKKYARLPGFTVTYKREVLTRSMAMLGEGMSTDLATGKFHFKPSYFLRVEQETPNPETVITDGETLWWYVPRKKEVYRYPSHGFGKELRLLSDIFHGLRTVEENFDVNLMDNDTDGEYRLRLTPNPPWQEIQHIQLSVDRGNSAIRVVEIYNYVGGMTRFTLGNLTVQEKFEEGFFGFVVPEGVKVIEGE
jgi:outer membrane lipoprotein-sorting protein